MTLTTHGDTRLTAGCNRTGRERLCTHGRATAARLGTLDFDLSLLIESGNAVQRVALGRVSPNMGFKSLNLLVDAQLLLAELHGVTTG